MTFIQKTETPFSNISITLKFPQVKRNITNKLRNSTNENRIRYENRGIKYAACFSKKLNISTEFNANSNIFAYNPFITLDEVLKKEEFQNKQFWIDKKGFI